MAAPRDPVADLKRIAYLLEAMQEPAFRIRAFRGAATALTEMGPDEVQRLATTGGLRRRERDRRGHRADDPREPARRGAGLPAPPGVHRRPATGRGSPNPARGAPRRPPRPHPRLRRRRDDPRDGRDRDRDRPRVPRHHRPLAAADRRQRARDRAPDGPARRDRRAQRGAGAVQDPHRDRGRHQRGRLARSDAGRPRAPGRRRRQRPLRAAHGRTADDPPHGHRPRRPEPRRPRPLHRADEGRAKEPTAVDVRRRHRLRRRGALRQGDRGQLAPERLDPPKRLLRLAVEAGCRVSIDSDAHTLGQLSWLRNGCERAFLCGVTPEIVVNALPRDCWPGPPRTRLDRALTPALRRRPGGARPASVRARAHT